MRVPWTARRSNQSILKEINSEYSLEGLMLKLKLQYFDHLMWKTPWKRPWCWEWLKAGGERNDRGWDGWMVSPNRWTWIWTSSRSWWWTGKPGMLQSMGLQRVGHDWVTEVNWSLVCLPSLLLHEKRFPLNLCSTYFISFSTRDTPESSKSLGSCKSGC